jgi:PAS domain S-box-containing protein
VSEQTKPLAGNWGGAIAGFSLTEANGSRGKSAVRRLREIKETFMRLFAHSMDALCFCALDDGRFLDVNEEFIRTSGYSREELIGRNPLDLGWWADPQDHGVLTRELLRDGFTHHREFNFVNKHGGNVAGLVSAVIVEAVGRRAALIILRDLSDRKKVAR